MAASDPRRVNPLRRSGPYDPTFRADRLEAQAEAARRIAEIDTLQVDLSRERAVLAERIRQLQDELFPPQWAMNGRAPEPHSVVEALPPVPDGATAVSGRRLRTLCLRLLHRVGRCTLRRLHALVHLHGYFVDASNPVKALGDALGHEADAGRAARIARGVYEPSNSVAFRRRVSSRCDDLILPHLDCFDDDRSELIVLD